MFRSAMLLSLLATLTVAASAQSTKTEPPAAPAEKQQDPALVVTVPIYANSTCPIMGKKISSALYTDVEYGRIWICCKGCDKKILKDVEAAYKTAYPTARKVENKACPITGKTIGETAQAVTLQGHEFKVCCKDCIPSAKANAQTVLAMVNDEKIVDLKNKVCPVTGSPVMPNTFAVIGSDLVRLSSPACIEEVRKDPRTILVRARERSQEAGGPSKEKGKEEKGKEEKQKENDKGTGAKKNRP